MTSTAISDQHHHSRRIIISTIITITATILITIIILIVTVIIITVTAASFLPICTTLEYSLVCYSLMWPVCYSALNRGVWHVAWQSLDYSTSSHG